MAVEQMRLISLFGHFSKLNDCLARLIDAGCFHPENTYNATCNTKGFSAITETNPLGSKLHKLKEVLEYCGVNTDEIGGSDEKRVNSEDVDKALSELSDELHKLQTEREDLLSQIEECKKTMESLKHFENLDIDFTQIEDSKFVKIKFGRISADSYKKLTEYVENPYMVFNVCSADKNSYWGVYITPADHEEETDRIFASLFFEQITLPCGFKSPAKTMKDYEIKLSELNDKLKKTEGSIDWYYKNRGSEFIELYSGLKREYDINEYRRLAVRYNGKFACIIGWVPASEEKKIIDLFKDTDYEVTEVNSGNTTHLGVVDLVPPTKMKNRKLFRPFEFYVEIYGVPGYKEVDPTAFVAITYTLLYGIMFADLGQGIALALAGLFMWYKMKMPLGKILVPCGISGAFFGSIFGSVFGNEELLNPVYKALGFEEKPINIMSSATTLLGFSVGIGIVLIIVAMITGVVSNFKKGNTGLAIFGPNGIAGVLLYSSVVGLVLLMVTNTSINTTAIVIFGIVLPLISIFLHVPLGNLIKGEGFNAGPIGDFLLESVFDLFETVLSYFTNTVSFLRVGAFVLIHAGMMMAFNSLAGIVGGGVPGAIMMIFGNIFVIALEGLLVGIQVLRLEFYEMFSRFYDGDGYAYKPITDKV